MKKILTFLLLSSVMLIMIFALSSCGILLKKAGLYDGYEYHVDGKDEITITGYKGESTKLEIPAWIDGHKVVAIAFSEGDESLKKIESIKIPKTILSLNSDTFLPCTGLKEITVALDNPEYKYFHGSLYSKDGKTLICYPQGKEDTELELQSRVTKIAPLALRGARNLKNVKCFGLKEIGELAFLDCNAIETIDLGTRLQNIGDLAFKNCSALTAIDVPDSVENIGSSVFEGCSALTSVSIGNGVKHIGDDVFSNMDTLTNVIEYEGAYYIGSSRNLYSVFLKVKDTAQTEYVIHPDANIIYASAFENCENMESIAIPNSLSCIGKKAFYNCKSLKGLEVPEALRLIEENTFYGCISITEIFIPSSVSEIRNSAFANCLALRSVTLSDRTASIGDMAFFECSALEEITLPECIKSIGASAFENCVALTSVAIPEKVSYIGEKAFAGCTGIESVQFVNANDWLSENVTVDPSKLSDAQSAAELLKSQSKAMMKLEPEETIEFVED